MSNIREKKIMRLTKELAKLVVTLKEIKKTSPILFEAVMANVYDGEQPTLGSAKQ